MLPLTVMQFCLANAYRDEAQPDYRYGVRHESVCAFLKKTPVDILSVKEIRTCMHQDGKTQLTPHMIVQDISNSTGLLCAQVAPVKTTETKGIPTYNPFYLAQFYNPKRVIPLQSHMFRFYGDINANETDPPYMGFCCLVIEYAQILNDVMDLSRRFFVESYHFPLSGKDKLSLAKFIATEFPQRRDAIFGGGGTTITTIRCGDFNTFTDDKEYQDYMGLLTANGFRDITSSTLRDVNDLPMYGTFYPFPEDAKNLKEKQKIHIIHPCECLYESQECIRAMHSTLDYFFISPNAVLEPVKTRVYTDAVSDHLPLSVEFAFHS